MSLYLDKVTPQRSLPDWVALSSPGPNCPLVPRVERLARKIRAAAVEVESDIYLPFENLYRPTRLGLGFTLPAQDVARRSAWAVVGEWLVAASLGAPCAAEGLGAAHKWFWRGSDREIGVVPDLAIAMDVGSAVELRALLPYLLDPLAAATRRDMLNGQSTPMERGARKKVGRYYTPGDVAFLMVSHLQSAGVRSSAYRWLDPAHGSGVFLRAVFSALGGSTEAAALIYGIDIDPFAAEATSFVLTAEDIVCNPGKSAPWKRWHRFRRNLATGDALLMDASSLNRPGSARLAVAGTAIDGHPLGKFQPWRLTSVFPETADRGFSRIVANPPYAPLQPTNATKHVPALHPVTGGFARRDISPVFVEVCTNLLSSDGALGIVLPLSVVASTRSPFPELRRHLTDQQGWLELRSFDRAPDALFGDDVKTRNSIVYLDKSGPNELITTPLYRWTSRTRQAALVDVPSVSVSDIPGVPEIIPKIGSPWERQLLFACRRHPHHHEDLHINRRLLPLEQVTAPTSQCQSGLIAIAPTAYNFLGVVRDPSVAVTSGHDSQNGFLILDFASEQLASLAYAVMCSRLAFWLWHVTGDGFHVTGSLFRHIPVPWDDEGRAERLANLGDRLWKTALDNAVISNNRGRSTVAFPSRFQPELIDEIDAELGGIIGVAYARRLRNWYDRLVIVDFESERRNPLKRKKK